MVKVSITLPNTAQITFESDKPEVIHEVVGLVLRDLPRDLMQPTPLADGGSSRPADLGNGSSVASAAVTGTPPNPQPSAGGATTAPSASRKPEKPAAPAPPEDLRGARSAEAQEAFGEFCRSANPLGDMRRVVVAAEAARRFFGTDSVDADGLATLFDLAGWRRPHNFTQTLRNAARDKFRWLERLPGRAGRYAPTDRGRAVTLGA